jgi:hypothetical protein
MYDRKALLLIRQSPLSKTPTNLPFIPGVTDTETNNESPTSTSGARKVRYNIFNFYLLVI